MKKLLAITLASAMILAGCGSASSTTTADSAESTPADSSADSIQEETGTSEISASKLPEDAIKIEDFVWEVAAGVDQYGDRTVTFNYTNNSPYPIIDVHLECEQRKDLSDEDIAKLDDWKEKLSLDDEEIREITVDGYNHHYTLPGEKSASGTVNVDGRGWQCETMEQYELFTPSMLTIMYVPEDGIGVVEYYDLINNAYGGGGTTATSIKEEIDNELYAYVPEIDAPAIQYYAKDTQLSIQASGVSKDYKNDYVEQCKKTFTNIDSDYPDGYFEASNEDGITVTVDYSSYEDSMYVRIEK